MIKKIIACGDIHIKNLRRQDEYQTQLTKFINECREIVKGYNEDEVRIVVAGDLLHGKIDISCEAYAMASWFLRQLDCVAKTIVIAGNHDANLNNLSRLDPISLIFSLNRFNRVYYLDKELDYQSGIVEDDNVMWCLYSAFDNFAAPDINISKVEHKDKTYVGLFHGEIISASNDAGYTFEKGTRPDVFNNLDFCIMGHIHKRQCIKIDGVPLVYCGSLIQQNHGENISGHGYVIWDVETREYENRDIKNEEYGYYTLAISDISELDNNKEDILNL